MVIGGHEESGAAADQCDEDEGSASTQNDGRDDNDESYPTQAVLAQEPQAILRFKVMDSRPPIGQREIILQLPVETNNEILINLGRLNSNDKNAANYQQLVRLSNPNRPDDKQIISREHSQ